MIAIALTKVYQGGSFALFTHVKEHIDIMVLFPEQILLTDLILCLQLQYSVISLFVFEIEQTVFRYPFY